MVAKTKSGLSLVLAIGTLLCVTGIPWISVNAEAFKPETIGTIETLPETYPDHWIMVHDFSFEHMTEGEIQIVDPLLERGGDQHKGILTASFIATYQRSKKRKEHYVMETFFSRGGRGGERTDVVTIWDQDTLGVAGEIIIPSKRITGMPKPIASGLIGDERFLGVYNFTPAQSVSIVDLEKRIFVEEVAISGCAFVLPNGKRSFTSICADGAFLTTHLGDEGKAVNRERTAPAFDPNLDPIFEGAAISQGVAYFPTFQGQILPVDIRKDKIEVLDQWWLTDAGERNWRPGGMAPFMVDDDGIGYFLMNPEGGEGTHKDGGAEVWRYDLAKGKRLSRITLNTWGLSLGTSGRGAGKLMHVTNAEMAVDVYRIPSGEYVRTLDTGAATPFMVYGAH